MIQPVDIFSRDPAAVTDFSKLSIADIFNRGLIPRVNQMMDDNPLDDLDPEPEETDYNVLTPQAQPVFSMPAQAAAPAYAPQEEEDYTAPLPSAASAEPQGARATGDPAAGDVLSFIKGFEGFYETPYSDYGQTSIGYGTRAKRGEMSITREEADARLGSELESHRERVERVNRQAGYNFAPNQLDALTSFDYNTGRLEQLTANGTRTQEEIAQKLLEYNKADGKPLAGLTRRRAAEARLFTKGY